MVIYLLTRSGVNVDPLGSRAAEGGARVFPERFPLVAAVAMGAGAMVGIVGTDELGPTVLTMGNTPVVGTAGAELTPRLLISMEPNGIPVRAAPPGVVGDVDVDVDVGVDDEAMLLEPEPHIPDIPDVSSIPEAVDIPDVADIPMVPDVAVPPIVAAVAGAAVPAAVPPPSKLAVDPNIPDGDIPPVEHVVPLVVIAPVLGIAIVPVTLPVGAGLSPSDVISVASIGIPVPPTDPSGPIPSGDVTPSESVAVSGSSTWANAGLQPSKAEIIVVTNKPLIDASGELVSVLYAARRSGGAMNSGPTGSLIVSLRIRSISAIADLSMCHPMTSPTGES
jgi:hypothetical protein